jgi:hypothetical protein
VRRTSTAIICFRVPLSLFEVVERVAALRGLDRSELARQALLRDLATDLNIDVIKRLLMRALIDDQHNPK